MLLCSFFQLEQIDLEVRGLSGVDKQKYKTRLASYKNEHQKLEKDFVSTKCDVIRCSPRISLFCSVISDRPFPFVELYECIMNVERAVLFARRSVAY